MQAYANMHLFHSLLRHGSDNLEHIPPHDSLRLLFEDLLRVSMNDQGLRLWIVIAHELHKNAFPKVA